MKKTITLLTGNTRKKESLENAVELLGITHLDFAVEKIWLPEIQAQNPEEVAKFAAEYGANKLQKPVIKMDSGFFVSGLNGFPGALVNSVAQNIGADLFFKIIKDLPNKSASIKNAVAYCEPGCVAIVFVSGCDGLIVSELSEADAADSFIDRLFIPIHEKNPYRKTMGEIRRESSALALEMWGDADMRLLRQLSLCNS